MKKRVFLKTGEFAKLCRTTKETLLHYDRKGIFHPSYISENGYRRYGVEQFFDFDMISLLRETGSTLDEIRHYREIHDTQAYLHLLHERADVLGEERRRLARREAMLRYLLRLTEETISSKHDVLLFEERGVEQVVTFPFDSEKMRDQSRVVECYAACLSHDVERGNTTDAPLGLAVPEKYVARREYRLSYFFTRADGENEGELHELPKGCYAVLFHRGNVAGHAAAFIRMLEQVENMGLRPVGDAYSYDLMSYFLTGSSSEYVAKHVVRVE